MARSTSSTTTKTRRYQPAPIDDGYSVDYSQPYSASSEYPPPDTANYDATPLGGTPDTSGPNVYSQGAATTPISTIPNKSVNFNNTSDLADQFVNNRALNENEGDMYQQYFGGEASRRLGLENGALLKSNDLYSQLEQNPGYSQQEIDAQLGNRPDGGNDFRDLLNQDYNSNYLSEDEQGQIRGNPYGAMDQLHPEELTNNNTTAFNASRGYIDNANNRLNQNYDVTNDRLNSAITPDLGMSDGYSGSISNIENVTDDRMQGAVNNKGLDMSGEYGRQAGMSDQEVEDTAAMGGQAVGARSRAAIQDLERQAAASGNSSPLAVAAMRAQFEDQNAVNSADAAVNARLGARAQQRDAATGVEGTRLGAERYKTGAQLDAASRMGDLATNAETNRERMRMQGAQDISSRRLGAASQLGQMGERSAMYETDANLGAERDWASRGQQANEFNQQMGYGAARTAEQQQSDRAAGLAENRQGVNMANQGNQFNRGYQVNATLANTNKGIADARRQGQAETRNYYTGQQQYQGQQAQQNNQNLLTNRQQTQQGRNAATQGSASWELGNKQSGNWWTKNGIPTINALTGMASATKKNSSGGGGWG